MPATTADWITALALMTGSSESTPTPAPVPVVDVPVALRPLPDVLVVHEPDPAPKQWYTHRDNPALQAFGRLRVDGMVVDIEAWRWVAAPVVQAPVSPVVTSPVSSCGLGGCATTTRRGWLGWGR